MKLPAPAGNAPAEPAMPPMAPMAPEATPPTEDLDFGGETPTEPTPETSEMPEAPADDKPFDKEPFDAGIDIDEESDPKKFIERLSGKIGQSLRDYTKKQGEPDFELEKFAINSLISATHTSEMDENDRNDIIKKINKAGENDSENPDMGDDMNDDNNESGDEFGDEENSDEEGLQEYSIYESEMANLFLDEPKKNNMFQDGSNDILDKGYGNVLEETEDYVIYEVIEEGKKKKKKTKKDACYHKVKSKYDVWPSAYASGALVKCRNVGAANWGNSTDESKDLNELSIYEAKKTDFSKEKESGLHGWFSRRGGEGSQGWVDCNTCKDGKCKPCGREEGEDRAYPSCRPTPGACKTKGRGESWGKKSANESEIVSIQENVSEDNYMFWQNLKGIYDDATEMLEMNHQEVDNLIADGHQWALEHIITSKDDVEEVYHFIESNIEGHSTKGVEINEGEHESNNYMFWSSLKTIQHASKEILEMDENNVDTLIADGHGWAVDHISTSADDMEEVYHFLANTLDAYDGDNEGGYEDEYGNVENVNLNEAKYKGKTVKLGKPSSGDVKKFKVYVKNAKGNVVKVNFGDPNMEIKRDNPKRRKSFRARHKCAQAKDRTTPKYWSCKMWSTKPVSKIVSENLINSEKRTIITKDEIKSKLHETFNQENMSEPLVEPIVKPTTKPAEPAPSRRNRPFTIEPDSIPQIDPKALNENSNVKTINVYVPDEIILKKITNIPTFNRVFGTKLKLGDNEMRVNHKQYADIIRLKDMLSGVEITDKTKDISENLNRYIA